MQQKNNQGVKGSKLTAEHAGGEKGLVSDWMVL
jgi:hypothetical protein